MIYASQNGLTVMVAAADTLVEYDVFFAEACTKGQDLFSTQMQPTFIDMMMDERFDGLRKPPYIFEHADEAQRDAFIARFNITLVRSNALKERHTSMLDALEQKTSSGEGEVVADQRSIAEIHGLDKDDRWDKRTDEEKEEDKALKEAYDEAKRKGQLTGDSFGPPKADHVHITDVRTSVDTDGKVSIDNVLAVKGLHKETDEDRTAAQSGGKGRSRVPADYIFAITEEDVWQNGSAETVVSIVERTFFEEHGTLDERHLTGVLAGLLPPEMEEALEAIFIFKDGAVAAAKAAMEERGFVYSAKLEAHLTGDDEATAETDSEVIATDGLVSTYFKVEIAGTPLSKVMAALTAAQFPVAQIVKGNATTKGSWLAFVRLRAADEAADILTKAGMIVEVYGANEKGERLVAKGASVVDTGAAEEIPPRPWNDRAAEIDAMTDEEKAANLKTYKGKEFIYSGAYEGPALGCVLYITPREWFEKHGTMYPERLDIGHLLPSDVVEVSPGAFQTKSRDWNSLTFELGVKRGFGESMWLQLHLNSI